MSTVEWIKDDAGFREELLRGRKTELRVALDLMEHGHVVGVGRCELRESFEDRHNFADEKDVVVQPGHVIEVKSRSIAFTSSEDYPYPTAFVCATRRWKARTKKPCAVVLYSEPTGAKLVIPTRSREQWTVTHFNDSRRGFNEEAFEIARELLRPWDALLSHLEYPCGEFAAAA